MAHGMLGTTPMNLNERERAAIKESLDTAAKQAEASGKLGSTAAQSPSLVMQLAWQLRSRVYDLQRQIEEKQEAKAIVEQLIKVLED